MKEFTITVISERPADPLKNLGIGSAGPIQTMKEKIENSISNVTLTAHLTDVEYTEAQALLENMKEDAKKP